MERIPSLASFSLETHYLHSTASQDKKLVELLSYAPIAQNLVNRLCGNFSVRINFRSTVATVVVNTGAVKKFFFNERLLAHGKDNSDRDWRYAYSILRYIYAYGLAINKSFNVIHNKNWTNFLVLTSHKVVFAN